MMKFLQSGKVRFQYKLALGAALLLCAVAGQAQEAAKPPAWMQEAEAKRTAGDFAAWRQILEAALTAAHAAGDKNGEAEAHSALDEYFMDSNQPDSAGEQFQNAFKLFQESGNRAGQAHALMQGGYTLQAGGLPAAALDLYLAGLKIFRDLGDENGEAQALNNAGFAYHEASQKPKAIAYLQQSVELYRALGERADKAQMATALSNLSLVYRSAERFGEALKVSEEALALRRALNDRSGLTEIMENQADLHFQMAHFGEAMMLATQTVSAWRELGDKGGEMRALTNLGVMESESDHQLQGNRLAQATTHLRQALAISEGPRESLGSLRLTEIPEIRSAAYGAMTNLLLAQHQPEEAFLWAERGKNAVWRDFLNAGQAEPSGDASPEELEHEHLLHQKVADTRRAVIQRARLGKGTPIYDLQIVAEAAETELKTSEAAFYKAHPRLARLRAARATTLSDIENFLPENTALLSFALSSMPWEQNLVLFCVTTHAGHATLSVHSLPTSSGNLAFMTDEFRAAYADPHQDTSFLGAELYKQLLADAAPRLTKKHCLLICPFGRLWGLPFGALIDKTGQPLAQNFRIVYAPHITFAQASAPDLFADGPESETEKRPAPRRSMALFGANAAQSALVKTLFPDAVSSTTLADNARLLHSNAAVSFNKAAATKNDSEQSAPSTPSLNMRQIPKLKLAARLAVLAGPATESKTPDVTVLTLLNWAFLNAGVKAQIIAFPTPSDARAAPFLKQFYTQLKAGKDVGTAQRDTIRLLRADPKTAHPAYWAPFFLMGNWEQTLD